MARTRSARMTPEQEKAQLAAWNKRLAAEGLGNIKAEGHASADVSSDLVPEPANPDALFDEGGSGAAPNLEGDLHHYQIVDGDGTPGTSL